MLREKDGQGLDDCRVYRGRQVPLAGKRRGKHERGKERIIFWRDCMG